MHQHRPFRGTQLAEYQVLQQQAFRWKASQHFANSFACNTGSTKAPDAEGFYTYTRPEGKQGGHGVGWSELPRYAFQVAPGWSERAVSIADLGGTEVCTAVLRHNATYLWGDTAFDVLSMTDSQNLRKQLT